MESKRKFLKRETRILSVVASVFMALALIVLVVVSLLAKENKLRISLVGSCVLLGIMSVLFSIVQIRVFFDYKSKNKYLCADGISNLCLTLLIATTALIYVFLQDAAMDLRYIIFVFAAIFVIWKIVVAVFGFKEKRTNAFMELILAAFWLLSGVMVLLTVFEIKGSELTLTISNYVLGVVFVVYILYSYVFKEPTYLETEEAIAQLNKEEEERQIRLNRFNQNFERIDRAEPAQETKQEPDIEQKFEKLKTLKEKGFITEEEFEERKKKLLDSEL